MPFIDTSTLNVVERLPGWQGRYFQYRTVSIWPRPPQSPRPETYALGVSAEAGEFAARHRLGLGVSYGSFDLMAQSTGYYRKRCAEYGWEPGPDDIIYRCNMILGETDDEADAALERRKSVQAPFPIAANLAKALIEQDKRNVGGEARPANVGRVLPISFCGGPERVIKQLRQAREQIGVGVIDIGLTDPGSAGSPLAIGSGVLVHGVGACAMAGITGAATFCALAPNVGYAR